MSIIAAILIVVGFVVIARFIGLLKWTNEVMEQVKDSLSILHNSRLDDHAKERALQSSAIKLFRLLGLLLLGSGVAVLAPFAVVWILDSVGLLSLQAVLDILQRWDFMLAATAAGFLAYFVLRWLKP